MKYHPPHPQAHCRSPSFLGVTNKGRGGIGVRAEKGSNGVAALARVVGCEHHLRENIDQMVSMAPNKESPSGEDTGNPVLDSFLLFYFTLQQKVKVHIS